MLAIIALVAFLAMGMAVFAVGVHHSDTGSVNCVAICIQAMRPLATAALIAVVVLIFAIFESFSVSFFNFTPERFTPFRHSLFRTQFTRWFSLLEHSPTA